MKSDLKTEMIDHVAKSSSVVSLDKKDPINWDGNIP